MRQGAQLNASMRVLIPTEEERALVDPLVEHFRTDLGGKRLISTFLNSVMNYVKESQELQELIHSTRHRIKEPDHLADKLVRKIRKCRDDGIPFAVTTANLFTSINDLAGIRLLHLHTTQMAEIDRCLRAIINEQPIELLEGPRARTWDNEYRDYFQSINIETQYSETMSTSVHYILASKSSTTITCEIQVRTLMEEVWGEVDHKVNYPHPNETVACREQIRALARATSSATRLVDAIFATVADANQSGE
jgi:ppGpp synthetase/RelA/SpoT-type nucleotidyltranferase